MRELDSEAAFITWAKSVGIDAKRVRLEPISWSLGFFCDPTELCGEAAAAAIAMCETPPCETKFKSRAERRTALLLSALGVAWEYESARVTLLNGEGYIPDFWLPGIGYYLEVKSGTKTERLHKSSLLARTLRERTPADREPLRVGVLWDDKLFNADCVNGDRSFTDDTTWCRNLTWLRCSRCRGVYLEDMCRGYGCRYEDCDDTEVRYSFIEHEKLWAATLKIEGTPYENYAHGGILGTVRESYS